MFTTVIQRFTQRLLPLALVVTAVGGMSRMALVAFFAPKLVEYFTSSSGSISTWQTEFYPVPIITRLALTLAAVHSEPPAGGAGAGSAVSVPPSL
jgi:hypothetical protein